MKPPSIKRKKGKKQKHVRRTETTLTSRTIRNITTTLDAIIYGTTDNKTQNSLSTKAPTTMKP